MSPHRSKQSSRRETSLRRRADRREQRDSFMIFCEGKTEVRYFKGLKRGDGPEIHPVDTKYTNADSIIKEAATASGSGYTEVWAVFDTECTDVSEHCHRARGRNIRVGVSYPCFELWLLLHHEDRHAPFQSADQAEAALKKAVPRWRKGDGTHFADFTDGVADACTRARRLEPTGEDHGRNPSTNLWRLVEQLRH